MKKQMILLSAMLLVTVVPFFTQASEVSDLAYLAKFSWEKSIHDFGQVAKDVPITSTFEFTNNGNAPLVIISALASCGCTAAEYTKGEVMPGEKGMVTATYNAAKIGIFNKTITVSANTEGNPIVLTIKGEVID